MQPGESILIAQTRPYGPYAAASLSKLITEPLPPITTCLVEHKRGMKRALLEVNEGMLVGFVNEARMRITFMICLAWLALKIKCTQ
jgi:hypothetical protein